MTEREWLKTKSVEPLRLWCQFHLKRNLRRERLFACACCRRLWDQIVDVRSRNAIEVAEAYADGRADKKVLARARIEATRAARGKVGEPQASTSQHRYKYKPEEAAELVTHLDRHHFFSLLPSRVRFVTPNAKLEQVAQTPLLRDIFGNPFRPVAFSPEWRTDTAVSLARTMYESREFGAMPILADALQDAGCDNDDILNHCRGAGPHVRGCWVVDLVLGKQ